VSVDHVGALEVGLGDVVTLTCSSAIGIDGSIGIVAQACRVLGVERDWLGGRVSLTLASSGNASTGWSPSLRVLSVTSPTAVRVEANTYTLATDPRTGEVQVDIGRASLDYFSAGDIVRCIPAGDWGTAVERSVVSIVGDVVTLDGAHSLSAGDDIDQTSYSAATATARAWAYIDRGQTIG
jgi:hypothetical protein